MAVQSVAMAAQNLWLLAHAEGLGACWLCAPLFVPELVREILDLPADWQAQGLMTLGWPAEEKDEDTTAVAGIGSISLEAACLPGRLFLWPNCTSTGRNLQAVEFQGQECIARTPQQINHFTENSNI